MNTWKVKEINKGFLVKGPAASFILRSKFDADLLCNILNDKTGLANCAGEKLIREGELLINLGNELMGGEVK